MKMRSYLIGFTVINLSLSASHAAPPPRYGGELCAHGETLNHNLLNAHDSSFDSTIRAALFEKLFAFDETGEPQPQLAALDNSTPSTVVLHLKTGIRMHDGRILDAHAVKEWLESLLNGPSWGHYLVLPIRGARGALASKPSTDRKLENMLDITITSSTSLRIGLESPYPFLTHLWASADAGVAVNRSASVAIGTGPFQINPLSPLKAKAFLHHRKGRPYLNQLSFQSPVSRPDISSTDGLIFLNDAHCTGASDTLVLAVGSPDRAALAAIDWAIDRQQIIRRFLPKGSTALRSFVGAPTSPSHPTQWKGQAKLTFVQSPPISLRLAKRLQLDLLRANIRAMIGPPSPSNELHRQKRSSLVLHRIRLNIGPGAVGRFHALAALAARYHQAELLSAEDFRRFGQLPEHQRDAEVDRLEAQIRQKLHLIPIAELPNGIAIPSSLTGARPSSGCGLILADAVWTEQ